MDADSGRFERKIPPSEQKIAAKTAHLSTDIYF
jgi:hypothetical protein